MTIWFLGKFNLKCFQDDKVIKSGLSNKTLANLKQANEQVGKAMTAIFISSKLVLQTVTLIGGK